MREILFRAKRKDNGEWVEGYYGEYYDGKRNVLMISRPSKEHLAGSTCDEIIPETVGQYTGLDDMHGKPIFEGDIVKLFDIMVGEIVQECGAFGIGCSQQIDYDYLASEIAEITGHNNTPLFCYNDNFVSLWELYWNYNQEDECCSVVEIIGNIHDNPELR